VRKLSASPPATAISNSCRSSKPSAIPFGQSKPRNSGILRRRPWPESLLPGREADEAFARRLHADLTSTGFTAGSDHVCLPSRQLAS